MADLTDFVETASSEPVLYVVGSGISIPFPSCLPSASDVIDLTLDVTAPRSASIAEKRAVSSALPELFYEALYQVAGDRAVSPWQLLRSDVYPPDRLEHDIRPSLGHFIVVYLAWRHGLPVVTTNFDVLFEEAAEELGLSPVVGHPETAGGYRAGSREAGEVAIWKPHGSVRQPSSICTTLQRISSYDPSLISKLRRLFTDHHSCLLAYSGRDIDLFPFIASFTDRVRQKPFWICLAFGRDHAIHTCPDRFRPVEGGSGRLARALLSRIQEDSEYSRRLKLEARRTKGLAEREALDGCRETRSAMDAFGARYIERELGPVLETPGTRSLAFGISLSNVDRYRWAQKYLERALGRLPRDDGKRRARAHRYLSSCHHNLSTFDQAATHAVRARGIATAEGRQDEATASLAHRDEALRMQHLPRLGVGDWRNLLSSGAYRTVLRFVVDAGRIYRGWQRAVEADETSDISLGHTFAEHLIRLLAILQGGLQSVGLGFLCRWLLAPAWRRLRRLSHHIGYAAGVGNAQKYLARLGGPAAGDGGRNDEESLAYELLSAERLFAFISHRHASGIVARDRAEEHRSQGNVAEAADAYRECIDKAREVHNRSLELKGHVGLARLGKPVECTRIRQLLSEIEGEGYEARASEILQYAGCNE